MTHGKDCHRCKARRADRQTSARKGWEIDLYFKPPDKAVILSEALRRSIANRGPHGAESKDPAMLVGKCSWELSGRDYNGR
jgi:hypothetical protein